MKCPSCSCENLPVRETGMSVRYPNHCGECGARLTEQCPVCWYQHPIGTSFCQADGTDIAKWSEEKALWKQVARAAHASITIRPWKWKAALLCAVLIGVMTAIALYGPIAANVDSSDPGAPWVIAILLGFIAAFFSGLIPIAVLDNEANQRRWALFHEQGYQALGASTRNVFLQD